MQYIVFVTLVGYLGERQGVVRMILLADRSAFLPEIIRLLFCFDMYKPLI